MKHRILSIITALALCLGLCPVTALAVDVAADDTLKENLRDTTITNVYGTVGSNKGKIVTVHESGLVQVNETLSGLHNGLIDKNKGTVTRNLGQITSNYGTISTNAEKGRVEINIESGTIETNYGMVGTNMGHIGANVPAVMDGYVAVVENRAGGIIDSNYARVNNMGTVTTNEDDGVVHNYSSGRVETNNAGGTVYNFAAGASVTTNHGVVCWAVNDIAGTNPEKASFSDVTTENNQKFIQDGCTVTAEEGYYFSETPTAQNADVVFENGAYTVKNIIAAPVTLTVTTAAIADAVAQVGNAYYATVQAAFDAAAQIEGDATVTLLKDVTVTEAVKLSEGTVTLDGQGHTITNNSTEVSGSDEGLIEPSVIEITGGATHIQNCKINGTYFGVNVTDGTVDITGCTINAAGATVKIPDPDMGSMTHGGIGVNVDGGTVTINSGSFSGAGDNAAGVKVIGGSVTINGGELSGNGDYGYGLYVAQFATARVSITGGTFTGTGSAICIHKENTTLKDLMGEGFTLLSNGNPVDLTENQTGSGTFTVGCAHPSVDVDSVTSSGPDENGVVTVTATCLDCEEKVTLGTLTMVGSGQTITYGDEFPTFEVQAQGLEVTQYKWNGKGLYNETSSTITPNVSETGELNYTCKVTFNVPGGNPADVTLTFSLTVGQLNISTVDWTVKIISPEKAAYNGQPQKIESITAVINDQEQDTFGEGQFDIQLVDASGKAAATQTDAGTYQIRLTGKGPLTGTVTLESPTFTIEQATPTIEWAGDAAVTLTYTGKAAELTAKPTVTVTGMTSYDGEAFTYSYAMTADGPYTPGLPTDAGTYYIKAAVPEQTNYTAAETAGPPLKLTIQKAQTEITTAPTAVANLTYNGTAQALVTAAEASVGEVQYSLTGEDGSWSKDLPTAVNAGEYEVWYRVPETANYKGVGAASVTATIKKAEVTAASQNLPVKNNLEKTYKLDLSPFLPALPEGQEYGELVYKDLTIENVNEQYIDPGTVTLTDSVLTVPVKAVDTTDPGSVALITVTIGSDNFRDISLMISVASTNKTPVNITGVTAAGWTYDGKPHPGYSGTPDAGEYTGELSVTYRTWPSTDELEGEPKDAGTYQVKLSVPTENQEYEGSLELTFTVEPAQVTVKADDQTATVGDGMPELTYQTSGLAEDETLKTEPTPVCDADMSKAGTYPITFSGGAVPDGGNYKAEIVYQPGTLTVAEKSTPPKPEDPDPGPDEPDLPVDPGQVETKTEVEEGISQVPEGLKNIPELDSPAELEAAMRTAVTQTGVPAQNTAVYDVKLMVSKDGGQTWTPATKANFPAAGLTVTLPYPAGTDSSYTFTVVHMFTTDAFGKTPGDTESPAVTNTEAGLRFTVAGLSPISVGWKEKEADRPVTPERPSGNEGGGSEANTYRVTVEQAAHGKVTSNRTYAPEDSTVTLTVTPDSGCVLDTLTVTDSRGSEIRLTAQGGGKYTFTMPGRAVTVKAAFAPLPDDPEKPCDGGADCPSHGFTDLGTVGTWYHEAVDYVLRNDLMGGDSSGLFAPNDTLTRAQFAQILYNKEGRPNLTGGGSFTDVAPGAWCAPAITWAAERGIVGGYGDGRFGPNDNITREQLTVMLWRYAGSPAAANKELPFHDANEISGFALEALRWAVENGILNGYGDGRLDPKGLATRAQTAQMLKNFMESQKEV